MKNIFVLSIFILMSFLLHAQKNIIVSSLKIKGNHITKDEIIFRELLFYNNSTMSEGELKNKIVQSKKNLTNLKLFNFIKIDYILDGSNVEILIELIERWYFWPYPIFEISERNFNSWWNDFKLRGPFHIDGTVYQVINITPPDNTYFNNDKYYMPKKQF